MLRFGKDGLSWRRAFYTASGMSMVSMLAMEMAQNLVDYSITGGVVDLHSPRFWLGAGLALLAGYLTPLPYNYVQLRRYNRSCH